MRLKRTPSVREVWELRTHIMLGDSFLDLHEWCSRFADYTLEDAAEQGLPLLADAIIAAASVTPGVRRAIELQYGIFGVDPLKLDGYDPICKCRACLGDKGTDGRCKYVEANVSVADREIAVFVPELATLWDLPWTLYTMELEHRRGRSIRALKQAHDREHPQNPQDIHKSAVQRLQAKMKRGAA